MRGPGRRRPPARRPRTATLLVPSAPATSMPSPAGTLATLRRPGVPSSFDYRMGPVAAVGAHTEAAMARLRSAAAI
jgi:hypothetical protein